MNSNMSERIWLLKTIEFISNAFEKEDQRKLEKMGIFDPVIFKMDQSNSRRFFVRVNTYFLSSQKKRLNNVVQIIFESILESLILPLALWLVVWQQDKPELKSWVLAQSGGAQNSWENIVHQTACHLGRGKYEQGQKEQLNIRLYLIH